MRQACSENGLNVFLSDSNADKYSLQDVLSLMSVWLQRYKKKQSYVGVSVCREVRASTIRDELALPWSEITGNRLVWGSLRFVCSVCHRWLHHWRWLYALGFYEKVIVRGVYCKEKQQCLGNYNLTPTELFHTKWMPSMCFVCVSLCVSMSLRDPPYEPPSVSELQEFLLADRRPTGHVNQVWPNLYIGNE